LILNFFSGSVSAGQVGLASRFCDLTQTASGRKVTCKDLVAAHRTLPFGTRVKVRNLDNGKSVTVTIVDRGPFVKGRIIDLTEAAANAIESADLMRVELSAEEPFDRARFRSANKTPRLHRVPRPQIVNSPRLIRSELVISGSLSDQSV